MSDGKKKAADPKFAVGENRHRPEWEVRPLTEATWADFETLFGSKGACGGCWCMHWRLRGKAFTEGKGAPNREAMRSLVRSGEQPGLIGYWEGAPVAWCALAPREAYPRLVHSKTLAAVDDAPVWSVVCFFITKPFRRRGLGVRMLTEACDFVCGRGAKILEGYPTDTAGGVLPDPFVYTGLPEIFVKAGFHEVARRSKSRPIFRKNLS